MRTLPDSWYEQHPEEKVEARHPDLPPEFLPWVANEGDTSPVPGHYIVEVYTQNGMKGQSSASAFRWSAGDNGIIGWRIISSGEENPGWVEWGGIGRPIRAGSDMVEVRFKNGEQGKGSVAGYRWDDIGSPHDIVAYKVLLEEIPF